MQNIQATKIFRFPGEEVEKHLRKWGHLPGDESCCCAFESYCEGIENGKKEEKERIKAWAIKNQTPMDNDYAGVWLEELLEMIG